MVLDFQYVFKTGLSRFFFGRSGLISQIKFLGDYGNASDVFHYFRRTFFASSESLTIGMYYNNVCSIDAAPGGTFDTQAQIADGLPADKKQSGIRLTLQVNTLFPTHSFIPTVSALAVNTGSQDFCQPLYSKNLVCSNETPFATYYAPINKNMPHISFDDDLVTWLKAEINGIHQLPTVDFNSLYPIGVVSGTEPLCSNITYGVSNLPPGATVTWSATPSNVATINQSGTVTYQGNGIFTVSAVITGTCTGPVTVFKEGIHAGPPYVAGDYFINGEEHPMHIWFGNPATDYNNVCISKTITTNMQVSGATSVTWSKISSGPGLVQWSQTGNNISFYLYGVNQTALFQINATNACGTTTYRFGFKGVSCGTGGGGGCNRYQVSPNPASGSSSFKVVEPNIPAPCDGYAKQEAVKGSNTTPVSYPITEIRVYDRSGGLKKIQRENKSTQATVSLLGLKTGVYMVEVISVTYREQHQLIVQ